MLFQYMIYIFAGLGAGIVTGLAGLSAAVVITPLLVSACRWQSYDAVTVALAADVLASFLSANTYRKNGNIDVKRGLLVSVTAFSGAVAGSYCGFLFSQAQPDGLGFLSMATTIFLGLKFILVPVVSEKSGAGENQVSWKRLLPALIFGCVIGWICGFTGSGGGALMLLLMTSLLRKDLKSAVGTSTMIMTLVALVGTISHVSLGAGIFPLPMAVTVITCILGAVGSAKFANKCEVKKLNRIVGIVLLMLGVVTLCIKLF